MHGFNFYKLSIIKARWIGGFGEIAWLDTSNWTREVPKWGKNEKEMINHMNEDHQNVIASALNQKFAIQDEKSKILAISNATIKLKLWSERTDSEVSFQ